MTRRVVSYWPYVLIAIAVIGLAYIWWIGLK